MASGAHRVVVIGGGFGGLQAATHLAHAPVELTLIDRRNFHLFQPLTYQVATGALSPACSRPSRSRSPDERPARSSTSASRRFSGTPSWTSTRSRLPSRRPTAT